MIGIFNTDFNPWYVPMMTQTVRRALSDLLETKVNLILLLNRNSSVNRTNSIIHLKQRNDFLNLTLILQKNMDI